MCTGRLQRVHLGLDVAPAPAADRRQGSSAQAPDASWGPLLWGQSSVTVWEQPREHMAQRMGTREGVASQWLSACRAP